MVIALFCAPLHAEEILLKDGTKITGKLTGITTDTFQVKTAYGDIQVPRAQITSINFPENQPKKDGDAEEPKIKPSIDESLNGTTYTNRTEKFQVTVPQGWLLAPELSKSPDIVAALKSPDQIYFFMVTPEKYLGTLSTYKVLAETQYQANFKDYEKISESTVKLDGKSGIRMVWHGKNIAAHDAPMKSLVYILPYENNRMVRLTFLTLEPLFDEGLATLEKIAASYQTITPPGK